MRALKLVVAVVVLSVLAVFSGNAFGEIRALDKPFINNASASDCDFKGFVQNLDLKVVKDGDGYRLRSAKFTDNYSLPEVTVVACRLEFAEKKERKFRNAATGAVETLRNYNFYFVGLSEVVLPLGETDEGYKATLPVKVEVKLVFSFITPEEVSENLYQTMEPVTVTGYLSISSSGLNDELYPKKPGGIYYLTISIDVRILNGKDL